ncbi:Anthranilate synthase component 1 [Fundidesulfovibrio magnetotacticus]|uniref:Anthranilate synthase component 1 n=1 Tax=Fundidesulfovibrio magnetotacticus TaxID=2730080 RepID=A0A6V8M0H5_9BACT|nr:anthranilate synthase component I family protein [Fundidesulfovibrio magnetotacticus]GFK93975.1 Anthranilate synthase component 1 [Fundidesulfovibrio magnetotacticus]
MIEFIQEAKWLPADVQTPISLYLGLVGDRPGILFESAEVDGRLGRYSILAWDFRLSANCQDGNLVVTTRDDRLKPLEELTGRPFLEGVRELMKRIRVSPPEGFADLPAITRGLYGYFGYASAALFEPKLSKVIPEKDMEVTLVLPGHVVLFDHLRHRCCLLSLGGGMRPKLDASAVLRSSEKPEMGGVLHHPGEQAFLAGVEKAKELIRQGECIQVVLSNRFHAPFSGDPFAVYRRLRQVNPSPYMFFVRLPRITLVGSSPEFLVRCVDGALTTAPIAGTRPRGADEAQDDLLAQDLLADPKERAEHVMLVDLGRNDLGRIAKPGTVRVEKFMQVEKFSHVLHLTSYVTARLKDGLDALDVIGSVFPAGTVSGAPKVRAMEIIADTETIPRGPYAGAIGWLGLDPDRVDLDTGILIRTMWFRDGMVHWQTGAGLVYDSDPAKEWQEVHNKARVLAEVLAGEEEGDVFTHR